MKLQAVTKGNNKKKIFLEALKKSLGIVSEACGIIGISRTTYYRWFDADIDFREAVADISEIVLDTVETALFEQIMGKYDKKGNMIIAPSVTALIFYLKCKGKKRGYVERSELAHVFPKLATKEEILKQIDEILPVKRD